MANSTQGASNKSSKGGTVVMSSAAPGGSMALALFTEDDDEDDEEIYEKGLEKLTVCIGFCSWASLCKVAAGSPKTSL